MDRLMNATAEGEEEIALGTDDVEIVQTFFKSWSRSQNLPRKTRTLKPGSIPQRSTTENEFDNRGGRSPPAY